MFLGINIFWALLRAHFNPRLTARAKMSLSRAQNIFMPANINSIVLLLAGDVELNPGPQVANTTDSISFSNPNSVLNCRMLRHGLRPLDVRGGGNCLFKSRSHQLYNDSSHDVDIKALGNRYLTDHPERFI